MKVNHRWCRRAGQGLAAPHVPSASPLPSLRVTASKTDSFYPMFVCVLPVKTRLPPVFPHPCNQTYFLSVWYAPVIVARSRAVNLPTCLLFPLISSQKMPPAPRSRLLGVLSGGPLATPYLTRSSLSSGTGLSGSLRSHQYPAQEQTC